MCALITYKNVKKLSYEEVVLVFKLASIGWSHKEIAHKLQVNSNIIKSIIDNKSYKEETHKFFETIPFSGMQGTLSGRMLNLFDPKVESISIKDMARSLAFKCRWNGMCEEFYSVAEHSLRVAAVAYCIALENNFSVYDARKYYAYGLIHDSAEYGSGDIISPIKHKLKGFKEIEDKLERTIEQFFGLEHPTDEMHALIKRADNIILLLEAEEIRPHQFNRYLLPKVEITPLERVAGLRYNTSIKEIELKFKEALLYLKRHGYAKLPRRLTQSLKHKD
jgi:uncharacterized protein